MVRALRLLAPAALALLAACSSYSVRYDYDPGAAFQGYRTWGWYAESRRAQGRKSEESPLTDRKVRTAVERQLAAQGFRMEAKADADFLVAYYPVYQTRRVRTGVMIGGAGWRRPWGYAVGPRFATTQVHAWREGTLVLEVIDNRSHQLVWQAAAEGALTRMDDPVEAQAQIDKAVADLLGRFPPK